MNWSRQNSVRVGRRRLIGATLLLLLLLAIDALSGGAVRGVARTLYAAAWRPISAVSEAVARSGAFASRRALSAENEALRREVERLRVRDASGAIIREENEALRALLPLAERRGGIAAPIASSLRSSPYGTFIIGAGSEAGIAANDVVLAGDGADAFFIVGIVSEVQRNTSLVRQLFAPGAESNALLGGAEIVVEGRGGGNARAQVPRAVPVQVGDPVISPELGGYAIGIVGSAVSEPAGAYSDVNIGLPVSLSALTFVYVVSRE